MIEIDLDSVIDRLLEGKLLLSPKARAANGL
jgi:hypothetical protein